MAAVLLCVVMAKEPQGAAKLAAATADRAEAAATDNSAEAPQTKAVVPKTQRRAGGANFNKHESTHPSTNQNHNFACYTVTKGTESGAGWRSKDLSYCKTAQSCTTGIHSPCSTHMGGLN